MLKDLETGKVLKDINGSKYFSPASNTKLLTLNVGLEILGDSVPAFEYYLRNDTLYLKGLGDPTFLHRDYENTDVINFLKKNGSVIVIDLNGFDDERYGEGWSWDDYNGSYQVERSALPIYGNAVHFIDGIPDITVFSENIIYEADTGKIRIQRERFSNLFKISGKPGLQVSRTIPFIVSDSLTSFLLQDTLAKPVFLGRLDSNITTQIYYSHNVDSLYTPLMQDSDNFLADQVLLMAGYKQKGLMNSSEIIQWAKENVFKSPDELLWIDGSGLSRYNLFTPRSIVYVLENLRKKYGEDRILKILPHGGISGTIENWYHSGEEIPYIFAKTGTLRNNHSLSGFLRGDSGRMYVFSFMHNNFPGGSASVKRPMQKVLRMLKAAL